MSLTCCSFLGLENDNTESDMLEIIDVHTITKHAISILQ